MLVICLLLGRRTITANTQKSIRKAPLKIPATNKLAGALRYTFELADVAVKFAIGYKVSACSLLCVCFLKYCF